MAQFYTNFTYTTTIHETSSASSQSWPITTYSKYLSSAAILHLTLVCQELSHTNRMWFHHKFISENLCNFLLTHSVHFNLYPPTRTEINKCRNIQDIAGGRKLPKLGLCYVLQVRNTQSSTCFDVFLYLLLPTG